MENSIKTTKIISIIVTCFLKEGEKDSTARYRSRYLILSDIEPIFDIIGCRADI